MSDIVERLRTDARKVENPELYETQSLELYAADALEAQEREIKRLVSELRTSIESERLAMRNNEGLREQLRLANIDQFNAESRLAAAELKIERLQRNETGHLNVICEQQRKLAAVELERDNWSRLYAQEGHSKKVLLEELSIRDARLAEAERLLRKWQAYADNESDMPLAETDAFLAADSATHRETPVT